jgi:GNAT superfamily N-acetyltransferase
MENDIRRLSIDDYDEVVRIWLIAGLPFRPKGRDGREMLAVEIGRPDCAMFGLYQDDNLIGVALAGYDGRRGWINRLAVDPDFRGQGLAGALIEVCEKFLKDQGAVVISALIEDINYPSITTFRKAGYHCHDELRYFAKRESNDV